MLIDNREESEVMEEEPSIPAPSDNNLDLSPDQI
jgi:hypothetical protein